MTAPTSTAVLVRLAQMYAAAHPSESDERIVQRAKALIASLRSAGLDVVFTSWVENPDVGQPASSDTAWDSFVEGMQMIYEQNRDRAPWRPEGVR